MNDFEFCNIKWGICNISQEFNFDHDRDFTYVEGNVNDEYEVKKNLPRLIGSIAYVEGLKRIYESSEASQTDACIKLDRLDEMHHRLTEAKRCLFDEVEDGLNRIRYMENQSNEIGRASCRERVYVLV